jgi:hypothetical protein
MKYWEKEQPIWTFQGGNTVRRWEKVHDEKLYELHPSSGIVKVSVRGGHDCHDM